MRLDGSVINNAQSAIRIPQLERSEGMVLIRIDENRNEGIEQFPRGKIAGERRKLYLNQHTPHR
jgi:hypothetical protein